MAANVSSELLADDVAQIFADWQETVTYRQIASTFDPKTQTRSDVPTDTPMEVVARAVTYRQVAGSAGMYQVGDLLLLVLGADLPEQPPQRTTGPYCRDGGQSGFRRSFRGLWVGHVRA